MRFAMTDPTDFLGGRTDFTKMAGANQAAGFSMQAEGLENQAKVEASNILTDAKVKASKMIGGAAAGAASDAGQGQMFSTLGSIGGSILGGFAPSSGGGSFSGGLGANPISGGWRDSFQW